MKWEDLLSLKRHGDNVKRLRAEQDDTRVGFDVDYDRIIFSSFFRSLQDKTQVVPFSKTSFVHTRLTHSLEVSVVGRSIGRIQSTTCRSRPARSGRRRACSSCASGDSGKTESRSEGSAKRSS